MTLLNPSWPLNPKSSISWTCGRRQRAFEAAHKDPGQHLQPAMEPELRLSRDPARGPPVPSPGGDRVGLWPVRGQRVSRRGLPRPRVHADDRAGRGARLALAQYPRKRFRRGKTRESGKRHLPSKIRLPLLPLLSFESNFMIKTCAAGGQSNENEIQISN